MEKELLQAGIIAIPIKQKSGIVLFPQPNFFVFDGQFGSLQVQCINIETGVAELTSCVQSIFKLVHREILQAENGKAEELIERSFVPSENLNIPVKLLQYIFSYQDILDNLAIVNLAFSHFSFRGALHDYKFEIDVDALAVIIEND